MYDFKIWIDADSCPVPVRDFLIGIGKSKNLNECFVANKSVSLPENNPLFNMIVCKNTPGAADDYIFENCGKTDIVITRDIPFAARLVEKKIFVMNDRGFVFTKDNIGERLSERNFNLNLSILGLNEKSETRYGPKELKKFADTFERQVSQTIVSETFSKRIL